MKAFWAEKNAAGLIRMANLATLNKEVDDDGITGHQPTEAWCRDAVLSEHSTLDWGSIVFIDRVRVDVVSQLVRHTKGQPRFAVGSWRPDWTGKPRPRNPEEKRLLASKWTPRALQAMARERLCFKAMKETNEYITFEMRESLVHTSPDLLMDAVGMSMVPACVYRMGCPFGKRSCGYFLTFIQKYPITNDIWRRYEAYDQDIAERIDRLNGKKD